jgi:hypothetical protein
MVSARTDPGADADRAERRSAEVEQLVARRRTFAEALEERSSCVLLFPVSRPQVTSVLIQIGGPEYG